MDNANPNKIIVSGRRIVRDRRACSDPGYGGPERRGRRERRHGGDKRQHPRFKVKDLTFIRLWSDAGETVGQVLDISEGGVSLRCFVNPNNPNDYATMDLLLSGENFTITRISFKKITDIDSASKLPFSPIVLKRYGLQFVALTPDQKDKLEYFILNHTLDHD